MKAYCCDKPGSGWVAGHEMADPRPGIGEILLKVRACGVCRTDLHLVDGELPDPLPGVVPGHEIVGEVVKTGPGVSGDFRPGLRIGVPWLGFACGECAYCRRGQENLCPEARFTGYQRHGGYAEMAVADARFCFPLPDFYSDVEAAPLLCAGLIGYRAYRRAGFGGKICVAGQRIGLYGFGAAAHIIAQVARHQGHEVLAFTRPGDTAAQDFARSLGASWAGDSDSLPPAPLDAAIIFAPLGALVPMALKAVRPGGRVVCAGIHMSDIPSFPYADLWMEREILSVANLTRQDAREFLALAPKVPVRTETHAYRLDAANDALADLRAGRFTGAAVLVP